MNMEDRKNLVAHPTTKEIACAIETMRDLLRYEYGSDFSFSVAGNGYTLAASNQRLGELFAREISSNG